MLEFTIYRDESRGKTERVFLDPTAIATVRETELRPSEGFWQPVAVITTKSGETFTVYDHNRDAGQKVRTAKGLASAGEVDMNHAT